MGGGGLYSTGRRLSAVHARCCCMAARSDGAAVLQPETVAEMSRNQIGEMPVGVLKTAMPELSNDAEFFPGMPKTWGLGFMINTEACRAGAAPAAWPGPGSPTATTGSTRPGGRRRHPDPDPAVLRSQGAGCPQRLRAGSLRQGVRAAGPGQRLPLRLRYGADGAALEVVVDQAHGLHEGVDGGRADEAPAAALQFLAERGQFRRLAQGAQRRVVERRGRVRRRLEAPEPGGQRARPRRRSSQARRALFSVDSILPRWRTMPASCSSRSTSASPQRASTRSRTRRRRRGNSRACAGWSASSGPDWKPSRQSFSNSRRSSAAGRPHSLS